MAGLFPGVCNGQNVDRNGLPQANAQLTVYQGGTLTLASCFQDIGLAIPAANPMTADQTGRLPFFYVADGVYRVRLIDSTGQLIYDYPQVASIGASSSGGGGSAVDVTSVFSTGDELWKKIGGIRSGWVRQNARTIGSATSGASERANADCQALFLYLWTNYPNAKCPVVGGRGASASIDWAANKQITLPDMRGRGPFGIDGMGNSRANVIPDTNVSSSGDGGDSDGGTGGEANHTLTVAEMPSHTHVISAHTHSGTTGAGSAHHHTGTTGTESAGHTHTFSGTTSGQSADHTHGYNAGDTSTALLGTTTPTSAPPTAKTSGGASNDHTHTYSGTTSQESPTHTHSFTTTDEAAHTHGFTTDGGTGGNTGSAGNNASHSTMSPFALGTWYIKL